MNCGPRFVGIEILRAAAPGVIILLMMRLRVYVRIAIRLTLIRSPVRLLHFMDRIPTP